MPTVDLHLPPQTGSTSRRKEQRELVLPLVAGLMLIARWLERARQRRALAALDDHSLRDIGITRFEAERETQKPFWR